MEKLMNGDIGLEIHVGSIVFVANKYLVVSK
jgi:hypothetical protein